MKTCGPRGCRPVDEDRIVMALAIVVVALVAGAQGLAVLLDLRRRR